ncbi:MAG: helix-turn-helix transcriptional regulator [Eubacteriales bacterium]|nr:helix-turn-helix transcriptional regulator [Eubacteriales bacterium]
MYYDLKESGKRIRNLRKQYGWTQEKLAEKLGIALNTVSRIEIGHRGISVDLAIEFALQLNTTLDYIYMGREPAIYQDENLREILPTRQ